MSFRFPAVDRLEHRALFAFPVATGSLPFIPGALVANPHSEDVYLTDTTNNRVLSFDTDKGEFSAVASLVAVPGPMTTSRNGDKLFVAVGGTGRVDVFALPSLAPVTSYSFPSPVISLTTARFDTLFVGQLTGTEYSLTIANQDSGKVSGYLKGPIVDARRNANYFGIRVLTVNASGSHLYVAASIDNSSGDSLAYELNITSPSVPSFASPLPLDYSPIQSSNGNGWGDQIALEDSDQYFSMRYHALLQLSLNRNPDQSFQSPQDLGFVSDAIAAADGDPYLFIFTSNQAMIKNRTTGETQSVSLSTSNVDAVATPGGHAVCIYSDSTDFILLGTSAAGPNLSLDLNGPTPTATPFRASIAVLSSQPLLEGDTDYILTLQYQANFPFDLSSFGNGDLSLTSIRPDVYATSQLVSVSPNADATQVDVTYAFPPPHDSTGALAPVYTRALANEYELSLNPNQVTYLDAAQQPTPLLPGLINYSRLTVSPSSTSGPDLVADVQALATPLIPGKKTRLPVVISNLGDQPLRKSKTSIQLFYSSDRYLSSDDRLLQTTLISLSLKSRYYHIFNVNALLPLDIDGTLGHLIAVVDPANTIAESVETNNSSFSFENLSFDHAYADFAASLSLRKDRGTTLLQTNVRNVGNQPTAAASLLSLTTVDPDSKKALGVPTTFLIRLDDEGSAHPNVFSLTAPSLPEPYQVRLELLPQDDFIDATGKNNLAYSPTIK